MRNSQKPTIYLSVLATVILLALLVVLPKNNSTQTINLISYYDWSHFAGAKRDGHEVTITPLARTIQAQNSAYDWTNPSVNLAGPSLTFKSDFTVDIETDGLKIGDAVRLYGGVPIVYDEWRFEPASVEIKNEGNFLKVSLWDGAASTPASVHKYAINSAPKKLSLERSENQLKLTADDNSIFEINAKHVFKSGKLWFGFSVDGAQSLQLKSLTVSSGAGMTEASEALTTTGHSPLTSDLKFGAAVALNPLLTDQKYRELALNKFNIWTPENELKAQFIHPNQKTYSFNEADLLVDTAIKNNIAIHGHALVFGEANPKWMRAAPASQRQAIMVDHVQAVVSHYKGRIQEWDVINEPLSDEDGDYQNGGNGLRHHLWYDAMGQNYIATALKSARAANPDAKLYINDYGLEADGQRWQALLKLVDGLQSQGVPLDGVGFQSHVYEASDRVNASVLSRHMQELAQRGLVVRISEIDVFGEDGTAKQARDYMTILNTCLGQPNCVAYSTWGITDKYGSTTEYDNYPLEYGNDLLWDSAFKPKPAYQQVSKILNNAPEDL